MKKKQTETASLRLSLTSPDSYSYQLLHVLFYIKKAQTKF